MNIQQTLAIIKPLAIKEKHTGAIIKAIEEQDFVIKALLHTQLSLTNVQSFYSEHSERSFYDSLCYYMSSGPVRIMVLEKENAVVDFRRLIGDTDPNKAEEGTLRKQFGTSIEQNAIHGSDSINTAQREILFFFKQQKHCVCTSC